MHKKLLTAVMTVVLGLGFSLSGFAQTKPDVLVKQRQSAMTLQGKYFGPLGLMAAGKLPYNAEVAARNAAFLDALSQMPWDGFSDDTKGEKSRALPEIYSNASGFKAAQDSYRAAVGKLVAATKGGGEAAVKAAIGDVNNNGCGSCHKQFRGN